MYKKLKYLVLTLVVAGGAFGAARILNVDTSFLTGDLTKQKKSFQSQKESGLIKELAQIKPSVINKNIAQSPIPVHTTKLQMQEEAKKKLEPAKKKLEPAKKALSDKQKVTTKKHGLMIPRGQTLAQLLDKEVQRCETLLKNLTQKGKSLLHYQTLANERQKCQKLIKHRQYAKDKRLEEVSQRSLQSGTQGEDDTSSKTKGSGNLGINRYNLFRPPLLKRNNSLNDEISSPDVCLPNVAKEKLSSKYFEITAGLYLNVGACDNRVVEIEFSHIFNKLGTEGKVLRFADADASKSYKVTYLGDDKYKVQYLTGDEAWEQTQIVNPLNERVTIESLPLYGSKYRVGLFELKDELVVISFKMQ